MRCAREPLPGFPDLATLELLCELQRRARTAGCDVRLHRPSTELVELIELAGLSEQLLVPNAATEGP